ncbi:GRAM domain-containing protein 2B-like [Xyrauchen texanus]|uniref:GRAM domain-containing protein 2B-like n=1 Tax=Xyrauchen texanus TaxID=154827 RepID=UPI0022423DE0|nr:GRAM domain-containing protein 2B-like [Xyrauchen texanus]
MTRPDALISLDAETDLSARKKTTLIRSKTLDPALLLQVQRDSESKCEHRKPQTGQILRTNSQYHKVFKDISEDEHLRQSYTCALQKDILYQGRLFVSDNWICFHSKVFGKDTKIVIPVSSVTVIKKTKTAILVPNALDISTAHERHVFVSFMSRDTTYKVLMSVCPHLVEDCPGISQIPSQSSSRGQQTSDLSVDLSDLEAPVRQTDQHMDDSSSSDCPESPDLEKTPKFPKCSPTFTDKSKQDIELDSHPQQQTDTTTNLQYNGSSEVEFMKTLRPVSLSLNTLVLVYLSLVCILMLSSCYMAFKIVSLEERLTSLVSMEFPHKGDEYEGLFSRDPAEICSVLSASLVTLEKIHRSLQRLLESVSDE